jgi:hypothetical protein
MFNAMISPMLKRSDHFQTQSDHRVRPAIRCEMCARVVAGEAKPGLSSLWGEDRRRNGDELRQFPQVLGSARQ